MPRELIDLKANRVEHRRLLSLVAAAMIWRGHGDIPTAVDLARALGVSTQTLYHWRLGSPIGRDAMKRIEQYINGTPATGGEGTKADTSRQA